MSRKLATIQKVEKITPIANADRLELLHIKGWQVVSQKGLHNVNDYVVFFEIDSFFKEGLEPFHSDLKARGTTKCGVLGEADIRGYLIKSIRLRGELSQGYVVPFSSFTLKQQKYLNKKATSDFDVTEYLGVILHEPPETGEERHERLMRERAPTGGFKYYKWKLMTFLRKKFPKWFYKGRKTFPKFIHKTDCVRVQNIKSTLWQKYLDDVSFQVTVKLDGSSITSFKKDEVLGVCSRNLLVPLSFSTNPYVMIGQTIHTKLTDYTANYAVQCEMLSPSIQGNFEGVAALEYFVYSIWDIDNQRYLNPAETLNICEKYSLQHVPILYDSITLKQLFPDAVDEDDLLNKVLAYADGPSSLNGKFREGLVFKEHKDGFSAIKAISNKYLLKRASQYEQTS